jgi:hypothetical protein
MASVVRADLHCDGSSQALTEEGVCRSLQEVAEVLDRLDELGASQERVTIDDVQECLGRNAFAPAMLTLGLLALSPIGDIPGAPTVLSIFIVTVGMQMVVGRRELWLPRFLADRSFSAHRLRQTARVFRPVVRIVGMIVWRRLTFLTVGLFERAIAALCVLLALTLPPLEVVPFGATVPSSVITGLAVALVARDGLLALLSLGLMLGGGYCVIGLLR